MQAFCGNGGARFDFHYERQLREVAELLKHPYVTVYVDARERGKIETFEVSRVLIQGVASEVVRDGPEWEALKAVLLNKCPFEAPFFKYPTLKMMRVRPHRLSYAGADRVNFRTEF